MRTPWLTWVWPIIILLSTLAVTLITFLFPEVGIRPVVIMCFLFIIPGMTIVRFFRTGETVVEWMLAIVLSFTIDAFVAGIILYAGQWSPIYIMSFLLGFCFSGAIAQLIILRPASTVGEPAPPRIQSIEVRSDIENIKTRSALEDPEDTKDRKTRINPENIEDPENIKDTEMGIDLENIEDPEDTKERPVVSLPFHRSFQEEAQEKTVPLKKPELSGKEA